MHPYLVLVCTKHRVTCWPYPCKFIALCVASDGLSRKGTRTQEGNTCYRLNLFAALRALLQVLYPCFARQHVTLPCCLRHSEGSTEGRVNKDIRVQARHRVQTKGIAFLLRCVAFKYKCIHILSCICRAKQGVLQLPINTIPGSRNLCAVHPANAMNCFAYCVYQ